MIFQIFLVGFATVLAAFGALLMKKGVSKSYFSLNVLFGGLFYSGGAIVFVFALKTAQLSILYPLTALTYVWGFILAKIFLQEKITKYKIFGLLFICSGIFILTAI